MIPKDCNEGKHFFVHNSEFCDRCNIDFDTWYTKIIEEVRKETCESLLTALGSLLKEQQKARNLSKWDSAYIYNAVEEDAKRKGWIE